VAGCASLRLAAVADRAPERADAPMPRYLRWSGRLLLLGCLAVCAPAISWAQQAEDIGTHWVHYSAINTSQLTPQVASAFGIERSAARALLNLAVLRKNDDGVDRAVRAQIRVQAVNLAGQRRNLEVREVVEQDAIYYIGTFRIHNEERITFRVSVQPQDLDGPAREFSFQQQFFVY